MVNIGVPIELVSKFMRHTYRRTSVWHSLRGRWGRVFWLRRILSLRGHFSSQSMPRASDFAAGLSIIFVMSPKEPLELPLQLAVQAVGQFHRSQLNVACVLLLASAEAALRARLRVEHAKRGMSLEATTFSPLLAGARLLLDPAPGPQLVGALKALCKEARNPAAHGEPVMVTKEQVCAWMVDVAVLYEWSRFASSVYPSASA
jgi:hypothetical protein